MSGVVLVERPRPLWYDGVEKKRLGEPPVAAGSHASFQTISPPYPAGEQPRSVVRLPGAQGPMILARPIVHVPAQGVNVPGALKGFPWVPPTAITSGSEDGKSALAIEKPLVAPKSPAEAKTVSPAAAAA